jgi:hypothetical protein
MSIRLLFLDINADTWLTLLRHHTKQDFEITTLDDDDDEDAPIQLRYEVTQRGLDLVGAASPELYDLIIVGNNRGTGLRYVEALPDDMRRRVIVCWNSRPPADEVEEYVRLGVSTFCDRSNLPGVVAGWLAASARERA